MATAIHPTAIIQPGAELGENVSIGPYSVIGENVSIGDGTKIAAHVVVDGHTSIGANNQIFSFTAIGGEPQSVSYKGEPTETRIGDNNTFRENITVNRGTADDEGITSIGSNNLFMAYVHIAHDCRLGSSLLFSNNASLAGHVRVEDYVVLAGYTLVHQFVRIGEHSFCGVNTYCTLDIPPYMLVAGNKAITHGINVRGMRRRGVDKDALLELKRAYKTIYRSGHTMVHAIAELEAKNSQVPQVANLLDFIKSSKRGVIR
jgi:UDP-N-acetylglucosamine acyltransferase